MNRCQKTNILRTDSRTEWHPGGEGPIGERDLGGGELLIVFPVSAN